MINERTVNTFLTMKTFPRYLPVTRQEGFDLRSHIESAGHQVDVLIYDDIVFSMHTEDIRATTKATT